MSEQLRGRWAGQRIPFGEGKPVPGAPCSNVCQEGKEGRRQMLARPASDVRQLEGLCLTKRSSSARTHREHERVPIQGCQTKDGSGVGCLGNIAKLKMMLRRKNARYLRNSCFIPSRATESRTRYRMTLSQ
jgi:hypothetical protein